MLKFEDFGIKNDPDADNIEILSGRKDLNEFSGLKDSSDRVYKGALDILRTKYKADFDSRFKDALNDPEIKNEIYSTINKGMSLAGGGMDIKNREEKMAIAAANLIEEKIAPKN
jgi:hypothetical protein